MGHIFLTLWHNEMRGDCEGSKKQVRGHSIMCGSTLKQGLELLTDMTKVNKKDLFRPNVTLVTWDILRMTNYELLTEFWMGLMHRTERQNDRPTNQRTHRLFDSSGISL